MSYADRYIEFMSSDEMVQKDPSDVYSVIKSSEIRDFFKNHIRLNVLGREQIVLKSYISIQQIWMDDKDMLSFGFSERAINQLVYQEDQCLEHFPLPFEDKSRLKLRTPFMEETFYGILDSGCGYPGEWYHYLWDENVMASAENVSDLYTRNNMRNCVSLSYLELNLVSGYSTLDWVERA